MTPPGRAQASGSTARSTNSTRLARRKAASGRDKDVAEALADVMGRDLTTENARETSECTATAIVKRLGGEGMIAGRVLTEDLLVPRTLHDRYS